MTDSMKPLRKAIDTLLSGQITYKGSIVKTYDEKVFTGQQPDVYILYSTQAESPGADQSDCSFSRRSSIDIEIIAKSGSEVSKDVIDDISNDIYQLVIPTVGQAGFTLTDFQVYNPSVESAITRTMEISETQSILRKIIKFAFNLQN